MKKMVLAILIAGGVSFADGDGKEKPLKLGPETTIEKYSQGKITIGGKLIRTDVLFLPDGTVQHPWKSKTRHVLTSDDISALLKLNPDILIIGTGRHGYMRATLDLREKLRKSGLEVYYLKTDAAIEKLKALRAEGKKVVAACMHIGC